MTFNPVAALNVLECKNLITEEQTKAIDLGSQTASINDTFLKNLINNNKGINNIQKKNLNNLSTKKNFTTKQLKVYFQCI